MNLIIDTNLLINVLLNRNLRGRLENVIAEPDISLLVSRESVDELQEVARRPKFSFPCRTACSKPRQQSQIG